MQVLAIDQGTTNTKVLVVDDKGRVVARASVPTISNYPQPGWAEQSAEGIWDATRKAIDSVAADAGNIDAIAISNQRETVVAWDAKTGTSVGPAILWQCSRTAAVCDDLIGDGHGPTVSAMTGLGVNPMFPAPKLAWILDHRPEAQKLLSDGHLRMGTVDAWLLWNLTGGNSFATDHSNASRTQLFDTELLAWSPELSSIFGAPISCLPRPMPSDSRFGVTAAGATTLPAGVPIRAIMGDSHAALYGHGVRKPGVVKATYGTGSSLMTLTPGRRPTQHGISSTIAWTDAKGTAYALEGNIFVSAQAAAFMGELLGIGDARVLSGLAQSVESSNGVTFVPALSGLGAPHWCDRASGTVAGMSHATTPAHLARATFDAIALQIIDVFEAMAASAGTPLDVLRADGGAAANDFLMQLQADLLGLPVDRATVDDVGALGAAGMAFAANGIEFEFTDGSTRFTPNMPAVLAQDIRETWRKAVCRVMA